MIGSLIYQTINYFFNYSATKNLGASLGLAFIIWSGIYFFLRIYYPSLIQYAFYGIGLDVVGLIISFKFGNFSRLLGNSNKNPPFYYPPPPSSRDYNPELGFPDTNLHNNYKTSNKHHHDSEGLDNPNSSHSNHKQNEQTLGDNSRRNQNNIKPGDMTEIVNNITNSHKGKTMGHPIDPEKFAHQLSQSLNNFSKTIPLNGDNTSNIKVNRPRVPSVPKVPSVPEEVPIEETQGYREPFFAEEDGDQDIEPEYYDEGEEEVVLNHGTNNNYDYNNQNLNDESRLQEITDENYYEENYDEDNYDEDNYDEGNYPDEDYFNIDQNNMEDTGEIPEVEIGEE